MLKTMFLQVARRGLARLFLGGLLHACVCLGILMPNLVFAADPLPLLGAKACTIHAQGADTCKASKLCQTFCPEGEFKWKRWVAMYAAPGKKKFDLFYPDVDPPGDFKMRPVPICGDPGDTPLAKRNQLDTPSSWTCENSDGDEIQYSRPLHCIDGTRPLYYFRPAGIPAGSNLNSSRVMIRISGGGNDCAGDVGCFKDYRQDQTRYSSLQSPSSMNPGNGLFGNPKVRRNYHLVRIEQCAGGRAIGRAEHFDRISRFHHGQLITEAVIQDVAKELSALRGKPFIPTQVVFQTQSAGSTGTYLVLDGLHTFIDTLAGADVDVRLNAHSALFSSPELEYALSPESPPCPYDSPGETALYCGNPDYVSNNGIVFAPNSLTRDDACPQAPATAVCNGRQNLDSGDAGGAGDNKFSTDTFVNGPERLLNDQWATALDASCMDSHGPDAAACQDPMHVLMFHVETPVFISAQKYDATVRATEIIVHTAEQDAWENEDFSVRAQMVADSLRRTDLSGHKDPVGLPGHGVFLNHCGGSGSHWGASSDGKLLSKIWDRNSGDYKSQLTYFGAWLNSKTEYQPYCASVLPAETCSSSSPLADAKATIPIACSLP